MIKVILDTNFLVYCAKQKIDYKECIDSIMKEGYEMVVPFQVVLELEDLEKNAKKFSDRQAAKLAIKLLEANKIKIIKTKGKYADETILSLAKGNIVATLDLVLREKLKRLGYCRIIVIKNIRKIAFD